MALATQVRWSKFVQVPLMHTKKRLHKRHLRASETNQILGWSDTTILLHLLVNSARLVPSLVSGSVDYGFGNAGRGLNPRDLHEIPRNWHRLAHSSQPQVGNMKLIYNEIYMKLQTSMDSTFLESLESLEPHSIAWMNKNHAVWWPLCGPFVAPKPPADLWPLL